jgi:hypothetical protein
MNVFSLIGPLIGIVLSLAAIIYCTRAIIRRRWRVPANGEIIIGPRAVFTAMIRIVISSAFLVVWIIVLGHMCGILMECPLVPIEWLDTSAKAAFLISLISLLVGWVGDRQLSRSHKDDEHVG